MHTDAISSLPEPHRSRAAFMHLLHTIAHGGPAALNSAADAAAQIAAEEAAADAAEAIMAATAAGQPPPPQINSGMQPGWLQVRVSSQDPQALLQSQALL